MPTNWSQKSRELAQRADYCDQLYGIYNGDGADTAPIGLDAWKEFEKAYRKKDKTELVRLLVSSGRRFPVPLPFVPFLRKAIRNDPGVLARNPETVKRLGELLLGMKLEAIRESINAPAKASQRMGQAFTKWVRAQSFGLDKQEIDQFRTSKKDALLTGSQSAGTEFACKHLGFKPPSKVKELDLVARVAGKYIVGEAKWLTDFGGSQDNQLAQAMHVVDASAVASPEVWRLGLLDGVVWLPRNTKMQKAIAEREGKIRTGMLSALLLGEFIRELRGTR